MEPFGHSGEWKRVVVWSVGKDLKTLVGGSFQWCCCIEGDLYCGSRMFVFGSTFLV